ncbi:hypothetical protein [Aneurinibacillus uraniidurans]|uniref:hypothetical protein n=1 Tax=Aneurinibacillus uraniidurans TaxID=2966586 RepID=UPI00234963A0|nr:hypothetical protein [Aneurinibacillus sp. B1]WCN37404.1 hypothetical protein PO771_16585 [Aneurinibacillus sp. B1]
MSTSTAITTLETLAAMHRCNDESQLYTQIVHNFARLPHFSWIGVYIETDGQPMLAASSADTPLDSLARQSILQIPIETEEKDYGKLTIIARPSCTIDEADYMGLIQIGCELGKKITALRTSE